MVDHIDVEFELYLSHFISARHGPAAKLRFIMKKRFDIARLTPFGRFNLTVRRNYGAPEGS